MLIEPENIGKVFSAVFDNPAGKAVLEHLRTLYESAPTDFDRASHEYFNKGKLAVLLDIKRFMKFNKGEN
jgi:hypothetical protein